jgi:hypothetical protein
MPSLGTATKLARGLREIQDDNEGPAYFASLAARQLLPTARVEYALRGDDALTDSDVRELMQQYIGVRNRRLRVNVPASSPVNGARTDEGETVGAAAASRRA